MKNNKDIELRSEGGWLNNPGFHGFSEMLYEYTSSSANNGSGFEGLGDNTYFWNYTCSLALIISLKPWKPGLFNQPPSLSTNSGAYTHT